MVYWRYRLELKDDWAAAKADNLQPHELAQRIVEKAKALPVFDADEELQDIMTDFEFITDDSMFDDFDDVLEQLYDWADQEIPPFGTWPRHKMCWIATF